MTRMLSLIVSALVMAPVAYATLMQAAQIV
jgi:hypothetical protein